MKEEPKKKRIKKRRLLIVLLILTFFILCGIHLFKFLWNYIPEFINNYNPPSSENYIKESKNEKYLGKGQQIIKNKEGYFTTFTTSEPYQKTYIEYKQNDMKSWGKNRYWGGNMADNGCGITSMSIILSGYRKNFTPEDLRKMYYPSLNNDNMPKELSLTFGIKNSGFLYDSESITKEKFIEHLSTNRPILICVWNKPTDNRWTTASHYMVLLATDGDSMVYISNPNGGRNNEKSSGWYEFEELMPYTAKAMFIEDYE